MRKRYFVRSVKGLLLIVGLLSTPPMWAEQLSTDNQEPVSCRDENGAPVDWWIALKVHHGYQYVYRDSNTKGTEFSDLKENLSDVSNGPLFNTLNTLYSQKNNAQIGYLAYNDQPPKGTLDASIESSPAHAKGLVGFDQNQGFWLIHSVPQFLDSQISSGKYTGLSHNAFVNGQSFFCVTYNLSSFQSIGDQLFLESPGVLQSHVPANLTSKLGDGFMKIINKSAPGQGPQSNILQLESAGHMKVTSLSKAKQWGQDFYMDLIAPAFQSDFLVRTWMESGDNLPTSCAGADCHSTYFRYGNDTSPQNENTCTDLCKNKDQQCIYAHSVLQINQLKFGKQIVVPHEEDHSKWAISAPNASRKIVCIGDINTQKGQRGRGGGAACIEDKNTWTAFYNLITSKDECK